MPGSDCNHYDYINRFAREQSKYYPWIFSHNCPHFLNKFQVGEKVTVKFYTEYYQNGHEFDGEPIMGGNDEMEASGIIVAAISKKNYIVEVPENEVEEYPIRLKTDSMIDKYDLLLNNPDKKYVLARCDYLSLT